MVSDIHFSPNAFHTLVGKGERIDLLLHKPSVQNRQTRNRLQRNQRARGELPCLITFVQPTRRVYQ